MWAETHCRSSSFLVFLHCYSWNNVYHFYLEQLLLLLSPGSPQQNKGKTNREVTEDQSRAWVTSCCQWQLTELPIELSERCSRVQKNPQKASGAGHMNGHEVRGSSQSYCDREMIRSRERARFYAIHIQIIKLLFQGKLQSPCNWRELD